MKIPFDLNKWLADKSQKVVTRDGRSVCILCTDCKCNQPIVALVQTTVEHNTVEQVEQFTKQGKFFSDEGTSGLDLFLVTEEPELTEFEKAVFDCIDETVVTYIDDYTPKTRVDLIQMQFEKWSPRLLDLASKHLEAESNRLSVKGPGVYKICPRCGERMERDDSRIYTSDPPQYGYICPKCGAMAYDTVMYDSPAKVEVNPSFDPQLKSARTPSPALTKIVENLTPEKLEKTKKEMEAECIADNSKTLEKSYYGN